MGREMGARFKRVGICIPMTDSCQKTTKFFNTIILQLKKNLKIKKSKEVFLGSIVVENMPAKAGNTGLIPDPRRSHILQSS